MAVQVVADRTALATGQPIGALLRRRFAGRARAVVVPVVALVVVASAVVVTGDLLAVGVGLHLAVGGPAWLWSLAVGVTVTVLVVAGSFVAIARVCKVLCLAVAAFVVALVLVDLDWGDVARSTLVPSLPERGGVTLLLGVLGATIPPYVLLWQNLHRLEEMRADPVGGDRAVPITRRRRSVGIRQRRESALDVACGMTFAVVVMFAVVATNAAAAGDAGSLDDLADVALALEPVAGSLAPRLFGVGLVASGLLALPVLAGVAASVVASFAGRECGFSKSPAEAPLFYGIVAATTVGATAVGALGVEPLDVLVAGATLNGLAAAPVLALVLVVGSDRRLVGDHRPGRAVLAVAWATTALMAACSAIAIASWL